MKHLKQLFLSMALTICLSDSYAQTYQGPESVDYYPANNCYYIGNTNSNQILKRSPNGTLSTFVSLSNAPYGIEIIDSILYACVGGSVRAYNLNTGLSVFNQAMGASFLNGITHDNNGNLNVTDFSAKKVYRINRFTQQFNVFVNNTVETPNGIIYDEYDGINPRLVYACWGSGAKVKAINLADSSQTTLVTTTLGNIDGIAKGNGGYFYLASWTPDVITRYDSTFAAGTAVTVVSGLNSPADIYYNLQTDTLAVPNSGNNTVTFHYFLVTGEKDKLSGNKLSLFATAESLQFSEPMLIPVQLEVYSIDGKLCEAAQMQAGEREVKLSTLQPGSYVLRMQDLHGVQNTIKFSISQ